MLRNKRSDLDLSGVHNADDAEAVRALRMSFGIRKGTQSCIDTMELTEKRMAVDLLGWIKGELGSMIHEVPGFGSTRSAWIHGFTDGRVFCALIHMYERRTPRRPRALALDLEQIDLLPDEERLNLAFNAADGLGIPQLISVHDMTHGYASARAIMTYVAMLRLGLTDTGVDLQHLDKTTEEGTGTFTSSAPMERMLHCDKAARMRSISPELPSDSEAESASLDSDEMHEVLASAQHIMFTSDKQAREDALVAQRRFLRLAESVVSEDDF